MGKGDKKTRKGKIFMGTYGNVRTRKSSKAIVIPKKKKVDPETEKSKKKVTTKKKTVAKKTTTKKKTVAKKTTTKKKTVAKKTTTKKK